MLSTRESIRSSVRRLVIPVLISTRRLVTAISVALGDAITERNDGCGRQYDSRYDHHLRTDRGASDRQSGGVSCRDRFGHQGNPRHKQQQAAKKRAHQHQPMMPGPIQQRLSRYQISIDVTHVRLSERRGPQIPLCFRKLRESYLMAAHSQMLDAAWVSAERRDD